MTKEEKQQLKSKHTLEKDHIAYWRFKPKAIYEQGALTITNEDGSIKFSPHGTWKKYYRSGVLSDIIIYNQGGSYWRMFYPNGVLFQDTYYVDNHKAGKAEYTDIQFREGNEHDTVEVRRWAIGKKGIVSDERIGFDAQGKRLPIVKVK
ncbi:hypothetical protein [Hymenobacter sp. CRA2]|uniref:hypothetical protein n=1 Tax=Hymenobacter sp. CRA2 TaxID=1955620 RepID=UPI001117AD89|nr:hypothetical protein [Hymenobacter sp. CRA2]